MECGRGRLSFASGHDLRMRGAGAGWQGCCWQLGQLRANCQITARAPSDASPIAPSAPCTAEHVLCPRPLQNFPNFIPPGLLPRLPPAAILVTLLDCFCLRQSPLSPIALYRNGLPSTAPVATLPSRLPVHPDACLAFSFDLSV